MSRVIGKEQLFNCEQKHFKSIQGYGEHTLFQRYTDIENLVNRNIDERYRYFLAQPVIEGETITWFTKPYKETPRRLSDLLGEDFSKYDNLKNDTLTQYKNTIETLKNEGQNNEAGALDNAIKFVNNDFIFCYDDIVVLGIWGMQLKENLRESAGTITKNLFKVKKQTTTQLIEEEVLPESEKEEDKNKIEENYTIRFITDEKGTIIGPSEFQKNFNEAISNLEIPKIESKPGYEFIGWDKEPNNYNVLGETNFTAQYRPTDAIIAKLPWYTRFWNWLRSLFVGKGCLRKLLWLLLILILLLLFLSLFKSCNDERIKPIPSPIEDKPWIQDDPRVDDRGGIYDPGNPYDKVPTPPEYSEILPPNQGEMPPIDTNTIIHEPGKPDIVGNRLNILMENEDKSIMDLAKEFKLKYPEEKYKVVYYDDIVKRMQIEVPANERLKLKSEIPGKFAPQYEIFVFDEALFEGTYLPNDPAFSSPDKSWYLKTINAPQAWDITKGSPNLTVAIVDNGFSLEHTELKSKVVMPYNVWLHSQEIFAQEIDHGTHVAGTALASMDNGQGLCGIAPNCAFMPVQVANRQGLMTTTSILDGILYALYQGADVINVSLGMQITGTLSDSEQRNLQDNHFKEEERLWNKAMEIADKHRTVVVVSAGNENMLAGVNPMSRPKNFVVVSALDKSNNELRKSGFSNYGEYSTISAPGVSIYSSVNKNDYQIMEGTSMAAPIVTGSIALMKSLNQNLTTEQIVCIMQGTGKHVEGKVGNLIQLDNALLKVQVGDFNDCTSQPENPSTGDVQILLGWDNYNDLDLVCTDPSNEMVWYKNKSIASGGKLEIDMNVEYPDSKTPIEHIFWPSGKAPNGTYNVYIIYYKKHIETNETPYKMTIKYGNKTEEISGQIKREENIKQVFSFTLDNGTTGKRADDLLREKEELQRRLDEINRQLKNIKNQIN